MIAKCQKLKRIKPEKLSDTIQVLLMWNFFSKVWDHSKKEYKTKKVDGLKLRNRGIVEYL